MKIDYDCLQNEYNEMKDVMTQVKYDNDNLKNQLYEIEAEVN